VEKKRRRRRIEGIWVEDSFWEMQVMPFVLPVVSTIPHA
jgi:hypothetical protein